MNQWHLTLVRHGHLVAGFRRPPRAARDHGPARLASLWASSAADLPEGAHLHTRVVIQSRLNSSRLPAKAMLTLGGLPAVVLVARRAANTGADVVVATSTEDDDDTIAAALARYGIPCFRGSLADTLGRFVGATADLQIDDVVVRLTADNCLPDGSFVDDLVASMRDRGVDYLRVTTDSPYGLGAEAFTVAILRRADVEAVAASDREHVTPWMRRVAGDAQFTPTNLTANAAHLRCTVDSYDDFVVADRALRRACGDPVLTPWRALLPFWAAEGGSTLPLPVKRHNLIGQGPWLLGTVQLGLLYGAANQSGLPDAQSALRTLRRATSAGVTHVDTARAYGASEVRIGQVLRNGLSERVGVVTKIRPLDNLGANASGGRTRAALRSSLHESLRHLKIDRLDALLVHRWSDWGRGNGAAAEELCAIRDAGTATVVGASLSTPEELLAALSDERVGYLQLPFNVLDRRWLEPDVRAALAARPDVIITVRSVFLQGLLVAGAGARWPTIAGVDPPEIERQIADAVEELGREGAADLCIAYVLGHEFVTSVVLGADTPEQVTEHGRLMRRAPLTASEVARVNEMVTPVSGRLLDPSRWEDNP